MNTVVFYCRLILWWPWYNGVRTIVGDTVNSKFTHWEQIWGRICLIFQSFSHKSFAITKHGLPSLHILVFSVTVTCTRMCWTSHIVLITMYHFLTRLALVVAWEFDGCSSTDEECEKLWRCTPFFIGRLAFLRCTGYRKINMIFHIVPQLAVALLFLAHP